MALSVRDDLTAPGSFTLQSLLRAGVNGRRWRAAAEVLREMDEGGIEVHPTLRAKVADSICGAAQDS